MMVATSQGWMAVARSGWWWTEVCDDGQGLAVDERWWPTKDRSEQSWLVADKGERRWT